MNAHLAIDPGACSGWALFDHNALLVECGISTNVSHVQALFDRNPFIVHVVIEKPQIYQGRLQKGDPNDLITLAIQVGEYVNMARRVNAKTELPLPHTWKGSVDKEIHNRRMLQSMGPVDIALVLAAKCTKKQQNNMIDAIGLGHWFLNRLRLGLVS